MKLWFWVVVLVAFGAIAFGAWNVFASNHDGRSSPVIQASEDARRHDSASPPYAPVAAARSQPRGRDSDVQAQGGTSLDRDAGTDSSNGESRAAGRLEERFQQGVRVYSDGPLEGRVAAAFERPKISGVEFDPVECHNSRCKTTVAFDDPTVDRKFMEEAIIGDADIGLAVSVRSRWVDGQGRRHATIYLYPPDPTPARPTRE